MQIYGVFDRVTDRLVTVSYYKGWFGFTGRVFINKRGYI